MSKTLEKFNICRFIQEYDVPLRWDGQNNDILSAWIQVSFIEEFSGLFSDVLSLGGIEVTLLEGGVIHVDIAPLCESLGVDPGDVYPKSK